MRALIVALLAAGTLALSASGDMGGWGGAGRAAAQGESSDTVLISEQLCTTRLIDVHYVAPASALFMCGSPQSFGLVTMAGVLTQSDGQDTPIFDPALDDPFTPEVEGRVDGECVADTNDDGEVCGAGDFGVDDATEVRALIDLRDDGLLDEVYRVRANDVAAIDVDANQLHEKDGLLWLFTFRGGDAPIEFSTSRGQIDRGQLDIQGTTIDCGNANVPPGMFFDEDCDNDTVAGDGAVAVRLRPNGAARGTGQLFVNEEGGETIVVDFAIVGEMHSISFTTLKTTALAGTTATDCTLKPTGAGIAAALTNPQLAVVVVRALDSNGTQITGAILDWEIEDTDVAFPSLGTTATMDLGTLGKGFPQAICGGAVPGTTTVTAATAEIASVLDPFAPDLNTSSAARARRARSRSRRNCPSRGCPSGRCRVELRG